MKCIWAWTQVYVDSDGVVRPCCAPVPHGNLSQAALPDLFVSPQANALRRDLTTKNMPAGCRGCPNLPRLPSMPSVPALYPLPPGTPTDAQDAALKNYWRVAKAYEATAALSDERPLAMIIQLGELCNLRCIMCPQDHTQIRRMTSEHIENLKCAFDTVLWLTITGGEPLVYKECWELADHFQRVASPHAAFSLLTNAQLLTKDKVERYFGRMNRLGLGINFDACTKETYEKIRVPGKWDVLMRNVGDLNAYRQRHGKKHWRMNMGFTLMKTNLFELRGAIRLAADLGMGFGLGMITGDWYPVKNARAYFEENIFRYPHLGCSKKQIEDVLSDALAAVSVLPEDCREGAACNIRGTLDYLNNIEQVDLRSETCVTIRAMNDAELAETMKVIVSEKRKEPIVLPFPKQPAVAQPAWRRFLGMR